MTNNNNNNNDNTYEYIELIRKKSHDLRDIGVSYKTMAKDCNVGYGTVRNFVCGYRDGMNEKNWEKFSRYIEETWDLLSDRKKGGQSINNETYISSTDGEDSTGNS